MFRSVLHLPRLRSAGAELPLQVHTTTPALGWLAPKTSLRLIDVTSIVPRGCRNPGSGDVNAEESLPPAVLASAGPQAVGELR